MIEAMNVPYVKEYNKEGELINPIKTGFFNEFPNRKERRRPLQKQRFHGNGKNFPLTVMENSKYLRYRQILFDKKGKRKIIEHYILS